MTQADVKRYGLICAKMVEVEAMKASNRARETNGEAQMYNADEFHAYANEIEQIVYKHDDQL